MKIAAKLRADRGTWPIGVPMKIATKRRVDRATRRTGVPR